MATGKTACGQRLVGREHELAQLDAALAGALAGRGRLVVLTGEPGIGKTALAREFVERSTQQGAACVWGTCWDGGGAPPYWPWVQIVRRLARAAPEGLAGFVGDGARWLGALLPELVADGADTAGRTADADTATAPDNDVATDSEHARFRLFDALASLLAAAGERRPLVVVLDDLHWADASSLHALEFVARALPDMPVLVIAAYRHVEAHARDELAVPLGGMARTATRLPLKGLDRDDVGRLAAASARGLTTGESAAIAPELIAAVHEASAGNPLYVDELVRLLARQGRLRGAGALEVPLPLPDGVRDVIRRRLAPLGDAALDVLRAAAVIGGQFRLSTLADVLGSGPPALLEQLDAALRAGLLVATAPDRFAFQHALVRDTLLESLGAARRAALHRGIAEALEELYADDPEPRLAEIAHHFLNAASDGGAERGVAYAARAAEQAGAGFAYDEAARLYARALDVAASLPADAARSWELQHGRGAALMRAGRVPEAQVALRAAAGEARTLDDPQRLARTALARTLGSLSPGLVENEVVALLEEALAGLDPVVSTGRPMMVDALRCRLRVQLALALYWSPDQASRREALVDEALALARAMFTGAAASDATERRALADRTLAFALAQGFVAVWGPDTVPRGLPISGEALELCERRGDPELGMQVRLWRISLLLELDDPGRADQEIAEFLTRARRLGQPRMLVYDPLLRALAAQRRGEFEAAERLTAEAAAQARDVPGSFAPIMADEQTFLALRALGRHAELEPLARRNADRLPALRRWRCGMALVLAEMGREEEARREFEQLAARDFDDIARDGLWLVAVALLAELCVLLGDRERARRLYALLVPYDGRNVVALGVAYVGPVARYLGLLATVLGEDERALGHLETARAAAQRMGALPAFVLTGLDAATVLVRRNGPHDAPRARALVDGVAHDATRRRMAGATARVAQLRTQLDHVGDDHDDDPDAAARATLRREQDAWRLDYCGRSAVLADAKGLHHLAVLLAGPGRAVAAQQLAGGGVQAPVRVVDLEAHRRRAAELREELEEARQFNDPERVARAGDDLAALVAELSQSAAGRGPAAERARLNVTRAIRSAIAKIAEQEPELGHLLGASVRTGSACVYEPDPGVPLEWTIRT